MSFQVRSYNNKEAHALGRDCEAGEMEIMQVEISQGSDCMKLAVFGEVGQSCDIGIINFPLLV